MSAETSTGVLQPIGDIARLAKENDTMMMLDTVLIPDGGDDVGLRRYLLEKFKLDNGGGFGRLKGKDCCRGALIFWPCSSHKKLVLAI